MCILDDMSVDFIDDWTIEDEGTTPAYIRPLNGFEQLVFNDYFIVFFPKIGSMRSVTKLDLKPLKWLLSEKITRLY